LDSILKSIVEFACDLTYDDLPQSVVTATKERLIDTLGCAFGAYDCEEVTIGRKLTGYPASKTHIGRILGSNEHVAADAAAFVNTCMVRNLDFNDSYPGGHPSDMMGALFTLAPVIGASGKKLIVAAVIAYEVFIHHIMAGNPNKNGFDQGCAIGMGAAAGLSNLLGISRDHTAHAVSITTVSNMQLRVTRSGQLSMWKGCATAYAIRNALFSVYLACEGMTAPGDPFLGRDGLIDHYPKPFEWKPFSKTQADFHIINVNLKYWPVAYQMQAAVWCGIELGKQIKAEDVVNIIVEANSFAVFESGSEMEKWDPKTRETADHSLPYILAWSLKHGEISSSAFRRESYLDPDIRLILNKITVELGKEMDNKYPKEAHMRAIAIDSQGNRYVADILNPIGHWMNPMSLNVIAKKFKRLVTPKLGNKNTEEALKIWENIETLNNTEIAFDALIV